MAEVVRDEDNPMLLKKPKKPEPNPLYPDMRDFPPAELTPAKGKVRSLVDWYKGPGLKPYVGFKNKNEGAEDAAPVPSITIGIKYNF